uniref:Secreted protein n=1 Tax=Caenorhabditis tropicalis TaxID=1561998 RepID=A0A1I7T7P7_9PELO
MAHRNFFFYICIFTIPETFYVHQHDAEPKSAITNAARTIKRQEEDVIATRRKQRKESGESREGRDGGGVSRKGHLIRSTV